jgi:hypothetical protein
MTDQGPESSTVHTRVGHASWDDNEYCGHSVRSDLAGHDGMWSLVSLAVGGPRLGTEEIAILDDLTVSLVCPDPRIWPLKMTRLASAYGNAVVGQCVGYLGIARSQVGGHAIGFAARGLVEIERRLDGDWSSTSLTRLLESTMSEGRPLPGFGVPFRPHDERVDILRGCMQRRGRTQGRYWRLVHLIEDCVASTRNLPVNIGGAGAAVLLDLGFTAEQVLLVGPVLLLPNYLANAAEGSQQRSQLLLRLPDAVIDYVGPPPRPTPRSRRGA